MSVRNPNPNNARRLSIEDIKDNLVIIKINRSYYDGISSRELYEYTRGYWKRKIESVKPAKLALSVAHGIVVEVYSIEKWVKAEQADNIIRTYDPVKYSGRIAFVGELAPNEIRNYYIGRNVSDLYKNGEADPVKLFLKHGVSNETSDDSSINVPMRPKNRIRKADGSVRLVCGRCQTSFVKSSRCPECGQLVME